MDLGQIGASSIRAKAGELATWNGHGLGFHGTVFTFFCLKVV